MDYGVEIREVPLLLTSASRQVDELLAANNLRRDKMSLYIGVYDNDDNLIGGGGLDADYGILKCIALSPEIRGTGAANSLISRLRSEAKSRGFQRITVSTKPEYEALFSSMAFFPIARTSQAVLLESTPRGLRNFTDQLASLRKEGNNGIIVMNANPFTKGHLYLISEAAKQVDNLYVLVVEEDRSDFPFVIRKAMVEKGTAHIDNVTVLSTGSYSISSETFPSYFLKKRDDVTDVSIQIDLDIFVNHIAPALGAVTRFAGNEPTDALTSRYNELMAEIIPAHGINFIEIERCKDSEGKTISASLLRKNIKDGVFSNALKYYASDPALLLASMARKALYEELNLTPKPGLVDTIDNGAHTDMDYSLMQKSIEAITLGLATIAAQANEKLDIKQLTELGLKTEQTMFEATCGVNTHKGAIFAMGLTLYCANLILKESLTISAQSLSEKIAEIAHHFQGGENTNGEEVRSNLNKTVGAIDNARSGYKQLFQSWLPWLQEHRSEDMCKHRLLLKIISEIDDTNVLHRGGEEGAYWLKSQAKEILDNCTVENLSGLNHQCRERYISPGGAADMLALTLLIDTLITQ